MTFSFAQRAKKVLGIALPSGGNSLLDVLNISIGMYLIAHFSPDQQTNTHNLVALGLGMSYWMFLFALSAIFYIGTNAQMSRAYGERNLGKCHGILSTMSVAALLFSLPVWLGAWGFGDEYFDWMGVDGLTKELGLLYLSVMFYTIPAFFLKNILISALAAIGDTKSAFFIKIFTTLLNIMLNFVLIFGVEDMLGVGIPSLGILGAAVANLITTYVETLMLLALCLFHKQLRFGRLESAGAIIKNAFRIGIPSGLERGLTILSLVLIARFMTGYGLEVIAGFQIGSRIEGFIFMPGFGFQVAAMALVGQMLGAKRIDLAHDFVKTTLWLSSVIMGLLGVGLCVFGQELSLIFSGDSEVVRHSLHYLIAVGLSQIPLIWIFVLDGALRGSGATKLSLLLNVGSIWLLRIFPMWLCVQLGLEAWVIFAIICVETFIRAGVFGYIFFSGKWRGFIVRF